MWNRRGEGPDELGGVVISNKTVYGPTLRTIWDGGGVTLHLEG